MTVISDSFERTNAQVANTNNLGANWVGVTGGTNMQIFSGDVYPFTAGEYEYARHLTSLSSKHQYAQTRIGNLLYVDNAGLKAIYLFLRMSTSVTPTASTWNFLGAYIAYQQNTFAGSCGIFYLSAGVTNWIAVGVDLGLNLAIGDLFRFEAQGQNLRLLYNGAVKAQGVLPVALSSGTYAGLGMVSPGSQPYQIAAEDWEAGDLPDPNRMFFGAAA